MINNLLELARLPQATFVFVLGVLVVFIGIAIIILVVSIIGKIMETNKKKSVKVAPTETALSIIEEREEVPAHVKAAIVAAISAYYFNQQSECEFRIKKIKRI